MGRQLYEAIVDGILGGGVYALMAVGLTLIFGVLDIINIAQGIMVVLAAYLSYVLSVHLHIDLFLGLLVTVPAMFVIGVVIQLAFMRPLRGLGTYLHVAAGQLRGGDHHRGRAVHGVRREHVQLHAWYVTMGVKIFRVLPALHLPVRVRARRRCWWPRSTVILYRTSSAAASARPCRTRPRPGWSAST